MEASIMLKSSKSLAPVVGGDSSHRLFELNCVNTETSFPRSMPIESVVVNNRRKIHSQRSLVESIFVNDVM